MSLEFEVSLANQDKGMEFSKVLMNENNVEAPFLRQEFPVEFTNINDDQEGQTNGSDNITNLDKNWYAMGRKMIKTLHQRLYKAEGYSSFSEYCSKKLGYSRQHIYKIIRVTQFIDNLWVQAKLPEQRELVKRLYSLGFTKLYILHTLEVESIMNLLNNGIPSPECATFSCNPKSLEVVSINQLKHLLSLNVELSNPNLNCSARMRKLLPLLEIHARSLAKYINECRTEMEPGDKSEQLQIIEQYAITVLEGILALSGKVK